MEVSINDYMIYLLVSCRMAGVVFFNPIFGRRNIPAIVKVGLSMGIALCAAPNLLHVSVVQYGSFEIILALLKELAVGFVMGFTLQLFLAIFHIGGGVVDLQIGLGMASLYDPASNSQISIIGNIVTTMYTLLFFISNSHVRLMGIGVKSFDLVPIGFESISTRIGIHMLDLFSHVLAYAVQLALPIIVTQFIVEVAVGILMRVVPNINVFVVNLQVKLGVGVIVILAIIPVLVRHLDKLNNIMLDNIQAGLLVLGGR